MKKAEFFEACDKIFDLIGRLPRLWVELDEAGEPRIISLDVATRRATLHYILSVHKTNSASMICIQKYVRWRAKWIDQR